MNILGISGYYHDSAAALVLDGEVLHELLRVQRARVERDLLRDAARRALDLDARRREVQALAERRVGQLDLDEVLQPAELARHAPQQR